MTPDLCAHAHHMRLCFRVFYIIKASHMVVLQRAGKELGPSPRVASHSMKAAVRRPGFIYFKRTAIVWLQPMGRCQRRNSPSHGAHDGAEALPVRMAAL